MNVVSSRKNERKKYRKRKKGDEKSLKNAIKFYADALDIACTLLEEKTDKSRHTWKELILLSASKREEK